MTRTELGEIDKDWGIQRHGTNDQMEVPLLAHAEWNMIREMTGLSLDNWEALVMGGDDGPMLK